MSIVQKETTSDILNQLSSSFNGFAGSHDSKVASNQIIQSLPEEIQNCVEIKVGKNGSHSVLTLKNLKVTVSDNVNIFRADNLQRHATNHGTHTWFGNKCKVFISNCTFIAARENENMLTAHINTGTTSDETEVVIENSSFLKIALNINNCRSVSFRGCEKIRKYSVLNGTKTLSIKDTYFQSINLNSDLSQLLITGRSKFMHFDAETLFNSNLRRLQFDPKCTIEQDGMVSYKILHNISRNLNDRLQSHILYNKELEAYSEQKGFFTDDSITIFIGKLANSNSRSTLQPIAIMLIFNGFMTAVINFCNGFSPNLYELILGIFNVWPLGILTNEESPQIAYTLDAIRKVGIGIMFYFTIASALRFKHKF